MAADQGLVRRTLVPDYSEGQEANRAINHRGEQLVADAQLYKASIASLGKSWSCQMATGSAYTNVANMPTTRAELALYNGYGAASGIVLVIDTVWMLSLTSITAASGVTLIYQVNSAAAALTDDTAQLINSPVGLTYSGLAKRAVAVTTMVANKWSVLNSGVTGAAASIGHGCFAAVDGLIQVRPGSTLGLNAVVGTATGTSLIGVSWHEMVLPQGL
jgi:hypothetical protein